MLKEFLQEILRLKEAADIPRILSLEGFNYAKSDLRRIVPPEIEPLRIHTLSGLVKLATLEENRGSYFVVLDVAKVQLVIDNKTSKTRRVIAQADATEDETGLQTMESEQLNFPVDLATHFKPGDGEFAQLLATVSQIYQGESKTSTDDGISQTVTTKRELTMPKATTIKPFWQLVPRLGFAEVITPPANYLLRVQSSDDITLTPTNESDWQTAMINNIAEHLEEILVLVVS